MQDLNIFLGVPFLTKISNASFISDNLHIPVDKKIFFFKDPIYSRYEYHLFKPDGILKALIFKLFKILILLISNGLDKNLILFFLHLIEIFLKLFAVLIF